MAYTDTSITTSTSIKEVHISELVTLVRSIATTGNVPNSVNLSGFSYFRVNSKNVKLLQTAVNALETSFSGNCCQANCCQSCQSCQGCQSCQSLACEQDCSCYSCYSCSSDSDGNGG